MGMTTFGNWNQFYMSWVIRISMCFVHLSNLTLWYRPFKVPNNSHHGRAVTCASNRWQVTCKHNSRDWLLGCSNTMSDVSVPYILTQTTTVWWHCRLQDEHERSTFFYLSRLTHWNTYICTAGMFMGLKAKHRTSTFRECSLRFHLDSVVTITYSWNY